MAPQKMLYIKDEDVSLISKAQECSKENFSNTVINALRFYVDSQKDADFDLQKIIVGFDPTVFERDILDKLSVPSEFQHLLEEQAKLVEDYTEYDLKGDVVLEYLENIFYQTQITFFGKELASANSECVAVYNLRGLRVTTELLEKALAGDFDTSYPYELVSMKDLEDDEEANEAPNSLWFGEIRANFKVFRTRGGKFLVSAITNAGDLNWITNDVGLIVPGASDYAILDHLNDNLKSIITENYGIEFELPDGLIQRAKQVLKKQRSVKHLDV